MRDATQLSDAELLVASKRRPALFGVLYERRAEELLAFFYRRTGDPHVAADLLAETMAIAFRRRNRYRPGSTPGQSWLYGIAKLELSRYHRKQRVELRAVRKLGIQVPQLDDDDISRIEALVDAGSDRRRIDEAMATLPDAEREIVELRLLDEADYATIADRTGVSEGTARVRVHRGLGRLATELGR